MSDLSRVYELAGGEVQVWVDRGGAIIPNIRTSSGDPVELAEHEAIEIGELLIRLAKEMLG